MPSWSESTVRFAYGANTTQLTPAASTATSRSERRRPPRLPSPLVTRSAVIGRNANTSPDHRRRERLHIATASGMGRGRHCVCCGMALGLAAPMSSASPLELLVAIPVFDDWEALARLLPRLDAALAGAGLPASVLIIDDASPRSAPPATFAGPFGALRAIDVLRLARNLGHQRAIAIGLAHLRAERTFDAVVVMDGDGEDRPEDVPRLVEALRAT